MRYKPSGLLPNGYLSPVQTLLFMILRMYACFSLGGAIFFYFALVHFCCFLGCMLHTRRFGALAVAVRKSLPGHNLTMTDMQAVLPAVLNEQLSCPHETQWHPLCKALLAPADPQVQRKMALILVIHSVCAYFSWIRAARMHPG